MQWRSKAELCFLCTQIQKYKYTNLYLKTEAHTDGGTAVPCRVQRHSCPGALHHALCTMLVSSCYAEARYLFSVKCHKSFSFTRRDSTYYVKLKFGQIPPENSFCAQSSRRKPQIQEENVIFVIITTVASVVLIVIIIILTMIMMTISLGGTGVAGGPSVNKFYQVSLCPLSPPHSLTLSLSHLLLLILASHTLSSSS